MNPVIYHNPRCSKSRETLNLLVEKGQTPEIVEYLKNPPDSVELKAIITALGVTPDAVMRTGEPEYKAASAQLATMSEQEKISWLSANPRVLQRPIVMLGSAARIGRPPESILEILP